jgi:hypothetical protein
MDELTAEQEQARMEEGIEQKGSPLLAYFRFNSENPTIAKNFTYQSIGMQYFYDKTNDCWVKRQRLPRNHIIRLGGVSASNPEAQVNFLITIQIQNVHFLFKALRLILLHLHGPTDWPTVLFKKDTFVEVAEQMNLIEDPAMWIRTINESFGELKTIRKRYFWLAQLIATSSIPAVVRVIKHVVTQEDYPLIPTNREHQTTEQKMDYVLKRLDLILRTFGKSCEEVGLSPQNCEMEEAEFIEVNLFLLFK